MALFPYLNVLVVHLADTDNSRGVSGQVEGKLFDLIMGARKDEPTSGAPLDPARIKKLSGKHPTPLRSDLAAVPSSRRDALEARYMFSETRGLRLYQFGDRLFAQLLGVPLPDAELFQASDGSLRSPVAPVVIEPVTSANDHVEAVRMTFRGRTQTGKRAD